MSQNKIKQSVFPGKKIRTIRTILGHLSGQQQQQQQQQQQLPNNGRILTLTLNLYFIKTSCF